VACGKPGEKQPAALQINEVLANNQGGLLDQKAKASDWIELHNHGTKAIELQGFYLTDREDEPTQWAFPEWTIAPGEHRIVFASGSAKATEKEAHTNFKLRSGESVFLFDDQQRLLDSVVIQAAYPNQSQGRSLENSEEWALYPTPSPNAANTTSALAVDAQKVSLISKGLRISEAQANNIDSIEDAFKKHSDWIEIENQSQQAIALEGLGLNDDAKDPFRWIFPKKDLAAGERIVVFMSGRDCSKEDCKNEIHASFKLSDKGETLQLIHRSGEQVDSFTTGPMDPNHSIGRGSSKPNQVLVFPKATPGKANSTKTYAGYTPTPNLRFLEKPDQNKESTTAPELPQEPQENPQPDAATEKKEKAEKKEAPKEPSLRSVVIEPVDPDITVRYTLDGSPPNTRSAIYKGPMEFKAPAVIRFRAWKDDFYPSPIQTHSILPHAKHSLPVMSLTVDPTSMFHPTRGMHSKGLNADPVFPHRGANYWNRNRELPAHIEYFEPDGKTAFSMPLGLRIFGAYSRAMPKKSFRLIARDKYGEDEIAYPLFQDRDSDSYDSFVLRNSGQDGNSSRFRDVLMTQLIAKSGVDHQGFRAVVLYLNGEYWGVYNLREKINQEMLARTHKLKKKDITILRANGFPEKGSNADYHKLIKYVRGHDLSQPEVYAYVQTQMDVENFAQFWIAQIFFSNADNGNIRFWREESDTGRWRWILYDLDWGWRYVNANTLASATNPKGTGANKAFQTILLRKLLTNDAFKDRFLTLWGHHLQHSFSSEKSLETINQLADGIRGEIPDDQARWRFTTRNWDNVIGQMRRFAEHRPKIIRKYLRSHFQLSDEELTRYGLKEHTPEVP